MLATQGSPGSGDETNSANEGIPPWRTPLWTHEPPSDDPFALRVFVVHEYQDDGNDASPIEAYVNEEHAKERCAMRPNHLTYTRVPVVDAQ